MNVLKRNTVRLRPFVVVVFERESLASIHGLRKVQPSPEDRILIEPNIIKRNAVAVDVLLFLYLFFFSLFNIYFVYIYSRSFVRSSSLVISSFLFSPTWRRRRRRHRRRSARDMQLAN